MAQQLLIAACCIDEHYQFKNNHVSILFCFFQRYPAAVVQLQGDSDPAGHSGCRLGRSPGRRTDLWHLSQDQVRRWLREPVFLLPDEVLCPLWGPSLPEIEHGKREGCDSTAKFVLTQVNCTYPIVTPHSIIGCLKFVIW